MRILTFSAILFAAVWAVFAPQANALVVFNDDFESDAATLRSYDNPANDFDPVIGAGDIGGTWHIAETSSHPDVAEECVVQTVNNSTPFNWASSAGNNNYVVAERIKEDFPGGVVGRYKGGVRAGDLDPDMLSSQIVEFKASLFIPSSSYGDGVSMSGWDYPDNEIPSEDQWWVSKRAFDIYFAPDGNVYNYDGVTWAFDNSTKLVEYTVGAWQDITLTVDMENRTFTLDVEGNSASASWHDGGADTIQSLLFNPNSDYVQFAVDNVSVEITSLIIPGDTNFDGKVDDLDAATLASNWLKQGDARWSEGDFNNDGAVNAADATILASNWQAGATTASAAVPEPGVVALLAGLTLAIVCLRHRK